MYHESFHYIGSYRPGHGDSLHFNRGKTFIFLLIFSFATYVRDEGVAGSNPATPTMILLGFLSSFHDRRLSQPRDQAPDTVFLPGFVVMKAASSRKNSGWWRQRRFAPAAQAIFLDLEKLTSQG
jgi:hypothetical protein